MEEYLKIFTDTDDTEFEVRFGTVKNNITKIEFNQANGKSLFGIVQGGLFDDLRIESLEKLLEINVINSKKVLVLLKLGKRWVWVREILYKKNL